MLHFLALLACTNPCGDPGDVCTVAGTGAAGASENEERADRSPLYAPMDVAIRNGADDFFIADFNNHKIRHVEDGLVHTSVGTVFLGDGDPDFKERNAPGVLGTNVALNHPTSLEWNPVTNKLLLPSWHNHRVRQFDPETGNSLVVCANTDTTDGNGANLGFAGDGGPAADALMGFPNSIAIDPADGSFWLLAQKNFRIRKVAADFSLIDTMAGTGEVGHSGDGGSALEATFNFWDTTDLQPQPSGAVEYVDGLLYVVDTSNHALRVIDLATGIIDAVPGIPAQDLPGGDCDPQTLCYPRDVEVGPDGRLFIADEGSSVIWAYDPSTESLDVVVGTFEVGASEDGTTALEASLNRPYGVDVADDGTLLIADTYNHRILRVTP